MIRRSNPAGKGVTRVATKSGFEYYDTSGRKIRDENKLARITELVIPPAWQDVWICPTANGHIQAVGVDAEGRRQYIYSPAWVTRAQAQKWDRITGFGRLLPELRDEAEVMRGSSEIENVQHAIGWAVRLLDEALIRVGSLEYQRRNGTYGLCTLERKHVSIDNDRVTFSFTGKSSIEHLIHVHDKRIAQDLSALVEDRAPSAPLLGWREGRSWRKLRPSQINRWLAQHVERSTAKDFRAWHGTVLAAATLVFAEREGATRETAERDMVVSVSEALGNTPSIARSAYIHPSVLDAWRTGRDIAPALSPALNLQSITRGELRKVAERAVLDLLDELTPRTMRAHANKLLAEA